MKRILRTMLVLSLVVSSLIPVSANGLQLNNPNFYSKSVCSEEQFLIEFECNAITETEKLGDYTISGTTWVNLREDAKKESEVVVLFLIEKDSYKKGEAAFMPLYLLDSKKQLDSEKENNEKASSIEYNPNTEYINSTKGGNYNNGTYKNRIDSDVKKEQDYYDTTSLFLYRNVEIPFAEEQIEKRIRLVAYIKSEENNLELNKNLQITDIIVKKEQGKGFYKRVEEKLKGSVEKFLDIMDKIKDKDNNSDGINKK